MAYIKRLKNNELIGGTDDTDVYPYTTAEAVYDKSKVTQQVINDRLLTKVSLLEESTNSLVNLKELIEEFLEGGDYGSGVLSDNNFTDALKSKLEGLENYNDSELRGLLNDVNAALNDKANKSTTYTKAEVDDKIANIDISSQISNFATDEELANGLATKQNTIANLQQIEDGAALGATAYQKPETGIPPTDLAAGIQSSLNKAETALQSHQDISGKANASDVYTKQTVDTMLSGKADAGSTYSKSVIDSKIATVDNKIPDTSAFRTETQINTLISTALVDVVYAGETTGTASSDGEGEGGGGVDSTAVHQTGTETVDGVKTLIGTLAVENSRGGQISCTDLDNFDWIVVRGGTTLQSVLTAMTNRIAALETKLASIYSYDSSTNTLTINDPNGNS